MSSFRFMLRDLSVNRLWSAWTRSYNVVKRCRRDRSVREVLQCFRQAFLRPRRTLLLSATAAFKAKEDEENATPNYDKNITDEDLEALLTELEGVEQLCQRTLYCIICGRRLVIDKKHPGVNYCACKDSRALDQSPDGWTPYMEAEDVIIWRKEYKCGQGLYAYKVYGRYKNVQARDFAAVQVDSAYRRVWDAAVASLSVVEEHANGVREQAILHWEVLWPRLFANRDYVYIRRHKEFNIRSSKQSPAVNIFNKKPPEPPKYTERPSVHSNAKRKSIEADMGRAVGAKENKVYVIISRSCEHPEVPESKHAIRVSEYWSNMVVKTIDGADQEGMEFVLTYYDEPAVGGLPSGVASWATGRAAPAYLQRMRAAAADYARYTHAHGTQDSIPIISDKPVMREEVMSSRAINEEDMESSKQGPEIENGVATTRDQSTQTDSETHCVVAETEKQTQTDRTGDKSHETCVAKPEKDLPKECSKMEADEKTPEEEENNAGWWRYLYPFYYFV